MTPARRIRELSTFEEAELEARRQDLLDQEWLRRKDKIKTAAWVFCLMSGPVMLKFISDLVHALGP
ncbi:MAG: hypothetical protein WKF94_09845 [Solirubrobacteraceae bacterium]